MNDDIDAGVDSSVPVWAVFGDLMSVMLGAFVLVLVGVIGVQLELSARLEREVKQRQEETQRREALEKALAGPLAAGRVTLVNGRIGISGSVLFPINSAQLQAEGREVLRTLIAPLSIYLEARQEVLMVSGFTDDQQVKETNRRFADNWELSAQRALTVTRALIEEGIAPSLVFAAAFGSEQPVTTNTDEASRAKNRRVEIAPIRKPAAADAAKPARE
ncbi:OmpA family protein [Pigmentiphaga litoralis]|uniref:Flagellar motor protein MotB n=1 Tax=Pigmentiphaga litoralis TaxID=516702 RepID=A0A7Y9IZC5_9BURK|nr:OmpA family protein [Pigmentiphaga litoralis]NYE26480.1 flagellar motor protein MotB [Pigmentiphaga litoralis]NYE85600.1 flagellar motor protein MotB [Pigmentiphaga litoralis]